MRNLEHACLYGRSTARPVHAPNQLQILGARLRNCSYCTTATATKLRGCDLRPICATCSDRLDVELRIALQKTERQRRG